MSKGRNRKVTPEEIRSTLEANGVTTVEKLAKIHNVTPPTIRRRLKELRDDGIAILPTQQGVMYIDIKNGLTEKESELTYNSGTWIIGEIIGLSKIGNVTKRPLIQVKKVLKLEKDEIVKIKRNLSILNSFISMIDIERELLE